jgi:hypothetical protein
MIQCSWQAVDPAEAKRLLDDRVVIDVTIRNRLFERHEPNAFCLLVIQLEPAPKLGSRTDFDSFQVSLRHP